MRTIYFILKSIAITNIRDEDPVLAKKPDPGLCTLNEEIFLKISKANILDNYENHPFCFNNFGVRRTIDVLDSENQPGSGSVKIRTGSGTPGLTGTSDTKSMKTKKKAYEII